MQLQPTVIFKYFVALFFLFQGVLACSSDGDAPQNTSDANKDKTGDTTGKTDDTGTPNNGDKTGDTASDDAAPPAPTSSDTGDDTAGDDTNSDDTDSAPNPTDEFPVIDTSMYEDNDSDGWIALFDCDDNDPDVHPGANEIPDNGIDDNCNGLIDEISTLGRYDWDIYIVVDNQFDIYFGTPWHTTESSVGRGDDWRREYHYTASGRAYTDYMYIATTSDQSGAQGFLGQFTNTTLGLTSTTADNIWEVFAAGAWLDELRDLHPDLAWPTGAEWTHSLLPTQAQVDAAITYAQTHKLWVLPYSHPDFDNDPSTPPDGPDTPWTHNPWQQVHENIAIDALWIWHDAGKMANGIIPGPFLGSNQDEFLVFRVAGAVTKLE